MNQFFTAAEAELARAREVNPGKMTSCHHGYAVLLEEVDELWDEVKKKRKDRDPIALLKELTQIAAVAARFSEDVVVPMFPSQPTPSVGADVRRP